MYKGRLFTFGCSFTQYIWPTWADILGKEFQVFKNWGSSGAGNFFISNSVAECCVREKLNKEDTVLIMWSNVIREDRYVNGKWLCAGNLYTQNVYDKPFIDKFVDIRGCYIRDLAQIYFTKTLLDSVGCNYKFMSMVDINNYDQYRNTVDQNSSDIINLYDDTLKILLPSVFKTIFNYNWQNRDDKLKSIGDVHPSPMEHLMYINTVLPEYTVSDGTINWLNEIQKDVLSKKISWNSERWSNSCDTIPKRF